METDGNNVGKWNLGYGSNMNVKHIIEKKGVKILGMAWRICVNINHICSGDSGGSDKPGWVDLAL